MIRGPILPQLRASVWAQMAGRLGSLERGLTLVFEGIDCSAGRFGPVEGLARDALGAPVLVLVAVDGDGLLTARAHAACEFLARVGDSLATALPEAQLVTGARGRVLAIGTDAGAGSLERLCRLPLPGLEVCRLETFRIAGGERLAARWLDVGGGSRPAAGGAAGGRAPGFEVPVSCHHDWDELRRLCERIDPGIAWDGDRFSRRITWQGRELGRVAVAEGALWGFDVDGARLALRGTGETHRFVDRLLRRYACLNGLSVDAGAGHGARRAATADRDAEPAAHVDTVDTGAPAMAGPHADGDDSLRATLSTARLSAEEYSALGGPTAVGAVDAEHGNIADDVARIVTAKSGPWHAQRRTD